MTIKYLRRLNTYRDVYSNRDDGVYNGPSIPYNTTAGGSIYPSDPYVHNFTRSGTRDTTTLVLFIIFVSFSVCLILMRLSCFFDPREERRRERDGQDHQSSNHTRSQESIEKMIVLKKVVTVVGKDLDLENAKKEDRIIKRIDRRKSNLLLHTNGGDELDESRTCPICLCEYEDGQRICWSHNKECAHHFHAQCGIAWLAKHTECPICRADYLVEPTDEVGNKENSPHTPSCAQNPITIVEEDEDQSVSSNTTIPQQLIMPTGESVPELETPQSPLDSVEGTTSLQASSETEDE